MSSINLNEALAAMKSSAIAMESESLEALLTKCFEKAKGARGEIGATGATGAAGRDGKDGADGRPGIDGKTPELILGNVKNGDYASASFRRDSAGVYILDVVLPKGDPGPAGAASHVPGPTGRAGKDGNDAVPPTQQDVEKIVRKVLDANPDKFRGQVGPAGEFVKGEKGDSGMNREEIKHLIVQILSDAGVLSEQAQKLVAIRAKLHAAICDADFRHQSQVAAIIKDVDKLF